MSTKLTLFDFVPAVHAVVILPARYTAMLRCKMFRASELQELVHRALIGLPLHFSTSGAGQAARIDVYLPDEFFQPEEYQALKSLGPDATVDALESLEEELVALGYSKAPPDPSRRR